MAVYSSKQAADQEGLVLREHRGSAAMPTDGRDRSDRGAVLEAELA
jgi:hypothetical protein